MDKETLKALKGSITKWNKIIKGTGKDYGTDNCPLCEEFLNKTGKCSPCPIAKKTKKARCDGTPYIAWSGHMFDKHSKYYTYIHEVRSNEVRCPKCKEWAIKERDFLKSLLPVVNP